MSVAEGWRNYFEANRDLIEAWLHEKGRENMYEWYEKHQIISYSRFLTTYIERLKSGEIREPVQRDISIPAVGKDCDDEYTYSKRRNLDIRDMLRTYAGDPKWTAPTEDYGQDL